MSGDLAPSLSRPAEDRGRVLHIGTSYYNNWYLSRALRDLGWEVETFVSAGEGASPYLHGADFYFEDRVEDRPPVAGDLIGFFDRVAREYLAAPEMWSIEPAPDEPSMCARRLARYVERTWPQQSNSPERQGELMRKLVNALREEGSRRGTAALFQALIRIICPDPTPMQRPIAEIVDRYDIVHFTGVNSMRLLHFLSPSLFGSMPIGWDVSVLKRLGKKVVSSNVGCLDGVLQSTFRRWGSSPICDSCRWRDVPSVCSDEHNRTWGEIRNRLADCVILLGGNHVDYNDAPFVHEVPEFYCLDPAMWPLDLEIPEAHRIDTPPGIVRIYHAVGDYESRTDAESRQNIKSTHVIVPTVERMKEDGHPVELVFCTGMSNEVVRYYQQQSDIVVDMLTFGFFGANVREAMLLGKPAVCFLRAEWLQSMREEIPEYVDEIPVVSATPETVYDVLADLVADRERREELGRRGREFILKWHSREAAGRRFDRLYSDLLHGRAWIRPAASAPPPSAAPRPRPGAPASTRSAGAGRP